MAKCPQHTIRHLGYMARVQCLTTLQSMDSERKCKTKLPVLPQGYYHLQAPILANFNEV